MSGIRSGVAKRVQEDVPQALFTHCYSNSLNLAAGDCIKKSKIMKSALTNAWSAFVEVLDFFSLNMRRQVWQYTVSLNSL